jgi:MFS family permease
MSHVAAKPIRSQRNNLIAAIATIAVCDIAFGLTFPLMSFLLDERGVPAWIIGLNAAMSPLGIIVAGPFIPAVTRKLGAHRLAQITILGTAFTLLAFRAFPSLAAWFVLRFVFGAIAGTLYTLSEAWIVHFAEGPKRGRMTGLYTSAVAITFSAGPLMMPYMNLHGWMPWLAGAAMVCAAGVPLMFVKLGDDFAEDAKQGFFEFVKRAPLLLFAVSTLTIFDSVMLAFFIIYGLRSGLDLMTASWALGISIAGSALLQYPIGMLADRWRRTSVMTLAAGIVIAMAAALPMATQSYLIWPVAFLMGVGAYAISTAALAILGDEFKGAELISGAAAFAATWGIGGIIGPPIAGAALDNFGVNALPMFFIVLYASLVVLLFASGGRLVKAAA